MALTTADLDAIDRAIATGELTVRSAKGSMVTYRSMAELLQAREKIASEIAAAAAVSRPYPRHQLADFSD